jgi:hypothetical protein
MPPKTDAQIRAMAKGLVDSRPESLVNGPDFRRWKTRVESFVGRLGPTFTATQQSLQEAASDTHLKARLDDLELYNNMAKYANGTLPYVNGWIVEGYIGVLQSLIEDIDEGFMIELSTRIASEIYNDIMNQADDLLDQKLMPCAAILSRVGLENGLRRLAQRHNVAIGSKDLAGTINQKLYKANVYLQSELHLVEGWLAVGNAFAHPPFGSIPYGEAHVRRTIADIRGFLGRHNV